MEVRKNLQHRIAQRNSNSSGRSRQFDQQKGSPACADFGTVLKGHDFSRVWADFLPDGVILSAAVFQAE
jgi:hypothetical protein